MRSLHRLVVGLGAVAAVSCVKPSEDYTRLYHTEPYAPTLSEESIAALDHLGPTIVERGVNFGVYSSSATRIDLLLFDDPESARPAKRFEMHRFGDVWNLYVEGVGNGQHYGYVAWGPNWPFDEAWYPGSINGFVADVDAQGNRFNPNKLLLDPYAKAYHRDHDWSRGSAASGPRRTDSTWGASAKSVVVKGDYAWSGNETAWRESRMDPEAPGHRFSDLVLYEVHPKGFTADPSSGIAHPGSYRGIGEMAPYLADLGVNAVELLPVHEKPLDGGYWGYWNLSYFAPEITFSSTQDPLETLDEFKEMVDQLHQHGVEVILDVVYNHTGEGGLWRERVFTDDLAVDPELNEASWTISPKEVAGIFSYRGLDNAAYYALSPDNQTYWNNTGVGHQTRPNNVPGRRLILDSLRFYVEELHVDGFRFDLAGILGEQDGNYNYWDDPVNTVLQDIADDPVLQELNTRLIAEPWTAGGNYGALVGAYPASATKPGTGFGEWNGRFRDWWRAFVNNDSWALNSMEASTDGGSALTGSQVYYGWNGRRPYHSVNYVTCHDGFTMYDLLSYDQKVNGCGPLNPVCCTDPASSWCEYQSGEDNNRSRNWGMDAEPFKRQLMRDFFGAMMVSHGTPMLFGGDEWMRTQYGNNNAYSTGADNEWNWFRWGDWVAADERARMHDFVRQMTRLRRDHAYAFAPGDWGAGAPFAWKNAQNADMGPGDWAGKKLMIHYWDPAAGPELLVLVNMDRASAAFALPAGRKWHRLVDTRGELDDPAFLEANGLDLRRSANATLDDPPPVGEEYWADGSTMVVLESRP